MGGDACAVVWGFRDHLGWEEKNMQTWDLGQSPGMLKISLCFGLVAVSCIAVCVCVCVAGEWN